MPRPDTPPPAGQPDHSMKEEEPLGWDQAPQEQVPDARKRHPRKEGKGGTPDEELTLEEAQGHSNKDQDHEDDQAGAEAP